MIKQLVITSIAVLGLVGGSAFASETPSPTAPQQPAEMVNPFAWMNMMNQQYPNVQRMNLARPEGYVVFMNPMNYAQFMNPATYGQFMTPQFYMQFADPNNMMAWMNPAAYGAYMNPASYMQMMNPAGYMQFMNPYTYMQWSNPANYQVFMDPNTYMAWTNPTAYVPGASAGGTAGDPATAYNWFDPNTWTNMMGAPAQPPAQPQQ